MKKFRELGKRQRIAWIIVGAVVLLAASAIAVVLLHGRGQVVVNTGTVSSIPDPETVVPLAPIGDSRDDRTQTVVIYCADTNYQKLVADVRDVSVTGDVTLEEAVVNAVLSTPAGDGLAAVGASDIQLLSFELSRGVATVNLSIDARRLDSERLHILRAAITNSLLELQGIQYVNVLIDDREECIIQLPAGTLSRFSNDLESLWLHATTEEQKYEDVAQGGTVLSRDVTLYFGAAGNGYILPEVRAVSIDNADYLGTIVAQLFAGPSDTLTYRRLLPSGSEYLREKPEIVTAEDGSKIAVLSFTGALSDYFDRNDIPTALAFASLARSICGFAPEVEGIICDIDGIVVNELNDANGDVAYTFENGIMRRSDFDSLVGEMRTLYYPSGNEPGTLVPVATAMSRYEVDSPRALLNQLMVRPVQYGKNAGTVSGIPASVSDADILGIRVEDDEIQLNLSGTFYQACQSLGDSGERTMIYSIVNTMCGLNGIKSVRFYFDGERVDYMAGAVYLRGPLLENAGMVSTGAVT